MVAIIKKERKIGIFKLCIYDFIFGRVVLTDGINVFLYRGIHLLDHRVDWMVTIATFLLQTRETLIQQTVYKYFCTSTIWFCWLCPL